MSEVACCAPDVPCAPPLQPAQLSLSGPAEECFCVDSTGLAQGNGIFRTHQLDVPITYSSGVRTLPSNSHPMHLINSDWAFAGVAAVVLMVALIGRRNGVRALGAVALSLVGAAAAGAVGSLFGILILMASRVLRFELGYGALGVPLLVAALTGLVGFVVTLRTLLRARAAERGWALLLIGISIALTLAVVGARSSDLARAYDALERAPTLVQAVNPR